LIKNVVIVDDDNTIILILNKFLNNLNFQVFSAENGVDGFKLIETEKPDLVISDMLIPGIHGVELCRKIKADPELKHIKVILMTSVYKGNIQRSEDLACNADGFIEKPFDFDKLKAILIDINDRSNI